MSPIRHLAKGTNYLEVFVRVDKAPILDFVSSKKITHKRPTL
jgi:hypothetical protein